MICIYEANETDWHEIAYGKNMTGISWSKSTDSVVTRIVPIGAIPPTTTIPGWAPTPSCSRPSRTARSWASGSYCSASSPGGT